jgi:3-dehydroshikimate dehydratase
MNLSVCTISFRHHLISLEEIARWAASHEFQGIELWGVHAKNLTNCPQYDSQWIRSQNMSVPMLSDYLPLQGDKQLARDKAVQLCRLCQHWGARKLRTFAGDKPSRDVTTEERKTWVSRLRELCDIASAHGVLLVVETHPNTLADSHASTLQLLEEVAHPALRLNLDVIHVWEAGTEPIEALRRLEPFVSHMHLKNITRRELLPVFAPGNVYAPAGSRLGMVELFEGAYDFERFLRFVLTESNLNCDSLDASLEWFGADVFATLQGDRFQLRQLEAETLGRVRSPREHTPDWRNAAASR